MKKTILILLCIPTLFFAQTRSEKVRDLNAIVDFMITFNYLNIGYSQDAVQLTNAFYRSKEEIAENYFYCSKTKNKGTVYFTGIEESMHFKELQPNDGKTLKGYQSEMIPFLKSREKVKSLLNKKKFVSNYGIETNLNLYLKTIDSLLFYNTKLNDYMFEKIYRTDNQFKIGKEIQKFSQHYSNELLQTSEILFASIEKYYNKELPLNASLPAIQNGEKEIRMTIDILDQWKLKILSGDYSQNEVFDAKIRVLNMTGMSKIDKFFTKTYGLFFDNANGWYVKTRYKDFFRGMESTIYHFVKDNESKIEYLDTVKQKFNTFSSSYKHIIDDYNRFIEFADGKTMKERSDGESPKEYNTNTNVMLKHPTLPRLFGYVDIKNPVINEPKLQQQNLKIVSENQDQNLINKSLPHHLVYLLDTSNSMNVGDKMALVKSNAKYLLNLQRESDKLSILTFADKTKVLLENKSCNQKNEIATIIDDLKAKGGTNINQGIELAIEIATINKLKEGKNKILLFTDGSFSVSVNSEKLLVALQEKQINFCIVYLGEILYKGNEKSFELLCERTKIKFYNVNKTNLKEILIKEATE
jgi:Mg-chelatase subunit ChlD